MLIMENPDKSSLNTPSIRKCFIKKCSRKMCFECFPAKCSLSLVLQNIFECQIVVVINAT